MRRRDGARARQLGARRVMKTTRRKRRLNPAAARRTNVCSCTSAVMTEDAIDPKCTALSACARGSLTALGLILRTWPNRAFGGNYMQKVVPALSSSTTTGTAEDPFSTEALGTLTLPDRTSEAERWLISCESHGGSFFLWLDDHLVCESGNDQPRWNPFRLEAVLPFKHSPRQTRYFLRATFVQQPSASRFGRVLRQDERPFFSLSWQRTMSEPQYVWGKNRWQPPLGSGEPELVPRSALSTHVPAAQFARLTLQRELLHGYWGTWNERSVSSHVMLPFGVELRLGLCSLRAGASSCLLEATKPMIDDGRVRLGAHGLNHQYTQLYFAGAGVNVSIQTAQRGRWSPLLIHAHIVDELSRGAAHDAALVVSVGATGGEGAGHQLPGRVMVERDGAGSISVVSDGKWQRQAPGDLIPMGGVTVRGASHGNVSATRLASLPSAHLAFALGRGARAMGVGVVASKAARATRTVRQVASAVAAAREELERAEDAYGLWADLKRLSQSAMMWNQLSRSMLPGPQTQCARGWGRPWVAFMWDDVFGALQHAIDARPLAYSQLTTLLKGKLSEGFVPNMWMPNWISFDRSGPPLGAFALRLLWRRYQDEWVVELLLDDVAAWLDWFWRRRRLSPLGLIALGSDPGSMSSRYNVPSLRMAKLESGMDNSPMYDEATFDNASSRLMEVYDVGMSSLLVAELRHLSALANASTGPSEQRAQRQQQSAQLAARAAELGALVSARLWNEELGAFTNLHRDGRRSSRVSPTSFYPLLAGIATDAQAARMVTEWLVDSRRFCVYVEGLSRGPRSSACHWGLPSISAQDGAFPEQDYWRGLVWAPNAFLVYVGLRHYDHIAVIRRARLALVAQMREMVLKLWHARGHVCENYSPKEGASNCTGDRFHQWGALASYISLIEVGYLQLPLLPLLPHARSPAAARAPHLVWPLGEVQPAPPSPPTAASLTHGLSAMTAGPSSLTHDPQTPPRTQPDSRASEPAAPLDRGDGGSADGDPWHFWRRLGRGWYSWSGWARAHLPHSWTRPPTPSSLSMVATPAVTKEGSAATVESRAGYAQAAAAAQEAGQTGALESSLSFMVRHIMGALGGQGIQELSLDRQDL